MKRRRGRLPRPLSRQCQPRGTFCHQRQKVPKERRQNPWFWIPCTGGVHPVQKLFCPANRTDEIPRRAFVSSLRLSPCKSACALALACRNYNLHCTPCPFVGGGVPTPRLHAPLVTFRRGRCPHRPARSSAAPLVLCHCEPVTDVTGVAIRVLRLKPPLRKGRWREAPEGSPYRTPRPDNADRVVLSATSGRKYPKNAAKTHGFGFLARAWYILCRNSSAPRIERTKSRAVLSYRPCVYLRAKALARWH